jgi:hypothetical protein
VTLSTAWRDRRYRCQNNPAACHGAERTGLAAVMRRFGQPSGGRARGTMMHHDHRRHIRREHCVLHLRRPLCHARQRNTDGHNDRQENRHHDPGVATLRQAGLREEPGLRRVCRDGPRNRHANCSIEDFSIKVIHTGRRGRGANPCALAFLFNRTQADIRVTRMTDGGFPSSGSACSAPLRT